MEVRRGLQLEAHRFVTPHLGNSLSLTKVIDSFFSNISGEESSWAAGVLPGIFRARSQIVVLCHTTVLRRLTSGRLLILRVLPLKPNKTLIECNIYMRSSRHAKTTQLELESLKKQVEVEVKALELQQESLLGGRSTLQSRTSQP